MPLPESNPAHIYRACLRECGYLPLPQCRSHMREFTIQRFRNFIPRRSPDTDNGRAAPKLSPEKVDRLLKQARKYASVIKHANEGYTIQLEKILRMTFGRVGPKKYELLAKYLYSNGSFVGSKLLMHDKGEGYGATTAQSSSSEDDALEEILEDDEPEHTTEKDTLYPSLSPTVGTTTFTTFYESAKVPKPPIEPNPPPWKVDLPPRLQALLTSQSAEQLHFARVGAHPRVKLKFSPPTHTIWGKPLPLSRYKNQRIKWYDQNVKAAFPPLETEKEYWELHDIVSGKKEFPALIPRRTPAKRSAEDILQEYIQEQSELILEGPKFGPRLKDWSRGRPHKITPRLLQRMISRVILSQTPLASKAAPGTKTEADSGVVLLWDDGLSRDQFGRAQERMNEPVPEKQAGLLFA